MIFSIVSADSEHVNFSGMLRDSGLITISPEQTKVKHCFEPFRYTQGVFLTSGYPVQVSEGLFIRKGVQHSFIFVGEVRTVEVARVCMSKGLTHLNEPLKIDEFVFPHMLHAYRL
jgi:hypothetical protein